MHGEKNAVLKATLGKLSPAKAQQAPRLEKIAEHQVWTTIFIGFLGGVEAGSIVQYGSKYWQFPPVDNIGSPPEQSSTRPRPWAIWPHSATRSDWRLHWISNDSASPTRRW